MQRAAGNVARHVPARFHAIEIRNGSFNSPGFICPNSTASVIAFDRETLQQSPTQTISLVTGTNNFGTISACGASAAESITYSLDGVPGGLYVPYHLFTGNFDFINTRTDIHGFDQINSIVSFDLDFSGMDVVGGTHTVTGGSMVLNGETYTGIFSNVDITAYGLIGEFITGNFTANVTDTLGMPHTITCTFDIKRDQ